MWFQCLLCSSVCVDIYVPAFFFTFNVTSLLCILTSGATGSQRDLPDYINKKHNTSMTVSSGSTSHSSEQRTDQWKTAGTRCCNVGKKHPDWFPRASAVTSEPESPVEPPRRNTYASWHWWGSSHPCTAPWWTCWFCPAPPHGPWFCPWSRGCPGSTRWTPAGVVPFFKPDSLALERRREGNY